jgi:hypothetical protein
MIPEVIKFVEKLLYVSLILFVFTTFYLMRVVKKENLKLIKKAITNPFFPNLNLSFFSDLHNEYFKIKKSRFLVLINKVAFYILLIGVLSLFFLVVIEEFIHVN